MSAGEAPEVVVVMPAYNAARTLRRTVEEIPPGVAGEIILVDDASSDDTAQIASELGLLVIVHGANKGYGGNQKTCYDEALRRGAGIIAMLHPDYQYDPKDLPRLIEPLRRGDAKVVFGTRMARGAAGRGGMPWWKVLGNRFLTGAENLVLGQRLSEYHSGYRAYAAEVLRSIPYQDNDDGFVFDQQIIVQIIQQGYRIDEIPISVKYFPEMSSVNLRASIDYGLRTLWLLFRYLLQRMRKEASVNQ
jgi:glycosyltransferase involved in cell wall biosynthesis